MEIEFLNAHKIALAADARTIEHRRLYHELRRSDRLGRALLTARASGALRRLRPVEQPAGDGADMLGPAS